jgi:hypothetical protein
MMRVAAAGAVLWICLLFSTFFSAAPSTTTVVAGRSYDSAVAIGRFSSFAAGGSDDDGQQETEEKVTPPSLDAKCIANGYNQYMFANEVAFNHDNWDVQNLNANEKEKLLPANNNKKKKMSACKSPTSNTRGTYTSHLVPCTFQFHHVEKDDTRKSDLTLSSACAKSNLVADHPDDDPVEQYVALWPDECVGDYMRCYSVTTDQKILLRHFCKESHKWDGSLPTGTTHVSVDCTADKEKKRERVAKDPNADRQDAYFAQALRHRRELFMFVIAIVAICLCACFVCLFCSYRYGIQPYLATLKRSKSDPELKGLVRAATDSGNGTADLTDDDVEDSRSSGVTDVSNRRTRNIA